jgi:tetratricopeptide (TPR) repeat protein
VNFALALLLLLGADEGLPPGHPPVLRSDAGPSTPSAGALPPGHPPVMRSEASPSAPSAGALPPGHPPVVRSDAGPPSAGALPPGHPDVTRGAAAPSAAALLHQLDANPELKTRPKPLEVSAALGKLYFTQGRHADAVLYLRQAQESAGPVRTLYLAERRRVRGALPDAATAGCKAGPDVAPGAAAARASERAQAGDHASAAACAREALVPALEAGALLGNALFLGGDAAGALAAYGWVLEVDPAEPEALYGRAGVRFDSQPNDVAALRLVKKDLSDFLARWPQAPQATTARALLARTEELLRAGGLSKFAAARPKATTPDSPHPGGATLPALSPETVEAIRNTERTPELAKGLAELIEQGEEALAKGQYQTALEAYRRVVPFQPDSGRAKAGMAWALVGLNRQPMAERVWGVAVEADPASVDALGDLLARKGNTKDARALWTKLVATSPAYAQKANLEKKLH